MYILDWINNWSLLSAVEFVFLKLFCSFCYSSRPRRPSFRPSATNRHKVVKKRVGGRLCTACREREENVTCPVNVVTEMMVKGDSPGDRRRGWKKRLFRVAIMMACINLCASSASYIPRHGCDGLVKYFSTNSLLSLLQMPE